MLYPLGGRRCKELEPLLARRHQMISMVLTTNCRKCILTVFHGWTLFNFYLLWCALKLRIYRTYLGTCAKLLDSIRDQHIQRHNNIQPIAIDGTETTER